MPEQEAVLGQPAGDDAAALEQQLRLGAMEERGHLEQARPRADAEGDAPRLAQRFHELRVRQRIRRGDVDRAGDEALLDEEADGADEVVMMDPGDELLSVTVRSAQAEA